MRVFKTKWFNRFTEQENIDDEALCKAIKRAEKGLIDADLGGCLIKIRIAKKGRGRSAGYRTLIAYKKDKIAIFLFGFAKNEQENISDKEEKSLKEIATKWVTANDNELNNSFRTGIIREVKYE